MNTFITYRIVNEDLFSETVIDVEVGDLKHRGYSHKNNCMGFYGSMSIEQTDGSGWLTITGEFSRIDFEETHGFLIVKESVEVTAEDKHWNDLITYNERFTD